MDRIHFESHKLRGLIMFEQPFLAIPFKNTSKAVTVLVAELPPEAAVSTNEALPSTHARLSQATVLVLRREAAGFRPKLSLLLSPRCWTSCAAVRVTSDLRLLLEAELETPSASPCEEGQHSSDALTKASHRYSIV